MNSSPELLRATALLGEDAMSRLRGAHVLIAGVGAVGGACAEALARSGVGRLTLLDGDRFEASNLNRQPFSARSVLGQPKVTVTQARLADIAPGCTATPLEVFLTEANVEATLAAICGTHPVDVIIDAIDDLPAKVALLKAAHHRGTPTWSAMGAARKVDPRALRVTDISKTAVCPLARGVRQRLRAAGIAKGIRCVWSSESPRPLAEGTLGSIMPVTASAGQLLAADVLSFLTTGSALPPRT